MTDRLFVLTLAACGLFGQSEPKQSVIEFDGHKVILVEPRKDVNGFAEEPAAVCLDVTKPYGRCWRPRNDAYPCALDSELSIISIGRAPQALFFKAWGTAGGSGSIVCLGLLQPTPDGHVRDLLPEISLSEISGHAFWNERTISPSPILVTANFVWGYEEGHFSDHRFIVSAYLLKEGLDPEFFTYELDDRYMTLLKYASDDSASVLSSEKAEILSRLKRVKAEEERQQQAPR